MEDSEIINDVELVRETVSPDFPLPVPQSEALIPPDPAPPPVPRNTNTSEVMNRRFPSVPVQGGAVTGKEKRWKEKTKAPTLLEKWQSKSWIKLVAIWLVAMLFLYLLHPPLICKNNARDDLDAYQCSYWRLAAWAAIAPLVYLLLPLLGME